MKTCDVCHAGLGLVKFRYADGHICKKCYKAASRNYTETICKMSFAQVAARCGGRAESRAEDQIFERTARIGNFVLFDRIHRKICLPNNRMVSKTYREPEIYGYHEIAACELVCDPSLTVEELDRLSRDRSSSQVIRSLYLRIRLRSQRGTAKIYVIDTPVRTKSYAFRRSFTFAKRMTDELSAIAAGAPAAGAGLELEGEQYGEI